MDPIESIMKTFRCVNFILILFLLVSCDEISEPTEEMLVVENRNEECLPPLYAGFSYPINKNNKNVKIPGQNLFVSPQPPWHGEIDLPDFPGIHDWEGRRMGVIQTRAVKNYFEIWIRISRGVEEQSYLAFYRTDTKEWTLIPELIDTLFVDHNNILWGAYSGYRGYSGETFTNGILSKFDENTLSFISEESLAHLPTVVKGDFGNHYSQVILDENNIFWIVVPKDGIYKYNTRTKEIEKYFEISFVYSDIKISSDKVIYILLNMQSLSDGNLFNKVDLNFYDTKTRDADSISLNYLLEPYPFPNRILIDSKGSVWLDSIAYRTKSGEWYQIQRSPLFISGVKGSFGDFQYQTPEVILESSDGRIWFLHSYNGMITLDPSTGTWCWFTTYQSNIVEDTDHNLWMIADNKLYKLPLGE